MADGTIHIDIKDNSFETLEAFQAACLRALEICGSEAEGYAKDLAPFDTGLLRNSITHALSGEPTAISTYKADKAKGNKPIQTGKYSGFAPKESDPSKTAVYIGTNVEYAPYMELGSRRQKPKPYLRPAVEEHVQTYRNIIEDELKRIEG